MSFPHALLELLAAQNRLLRTREKIDDLVQERVDHAEDDVARIGPMCGSGNEFYLKSLFKRRFGMTMREWRRTYAK